MIIIINCTRIIIFLEVEPGLDYFICVGTNRGGVRANFKVDGVDLGYYHNYPNPKQNDFKGNWSRKVFHNIHHSSSILRKLVVMVKSRELLLE